MTVKKNEFISLLEKKLRGLPEEDVQRTLEYYSEIIDDRIEDGADEESAVSGLGDVNDICDRIWSEASLPKVARARLKRARALKTWELVLIILGSPVWLPLLLALAVIILAVYAVLWAVVASLYAVGASLGGVALGAIVPGIISLASGSAGVGICWLGASMICAGACIFAVFGCNRFAKLAIFISKRPTLWLKALIIERRAANEDE